jgi:hypothetical protein
MGTQFGRALSIAAAAMIVLAALVVVPAQAQVTSGTVSGTVKDAQGGVIPGATVTLISEARGTQSTPVVTSASGDFVFANVAADTYTVEIAMPSFKTLKRAGIAISPGARVALGTLTIDVGGASEVVTVTGEAPVIQATTGDRSFAVTTDAVQNLPIANRGFTALAALAPGMNGTARIGGGGDPNFMMDGVSTMDTGSNRVLIQMNVESIAEVKVLVSNYQAEYGRNSGVQIAAVTKGGTNRFHGSVYDVQRNSDWNSNLKTNELNGDPKTALKEKDIGYSIGGPVGKPGGNNKLFFFYAQEFEPRTGGNDVVRFRMPTALERQGDFSQTTDNLGNPYPYIKDPLLTGACNATNQAACFQAGGVLGRIPSNRQYDTGLNILKMYPLPNVDVAGAGYNYQMTRPTEKILGWQPAVRLDYQPMQRLRATFKYTGWQQRKQTINGSIPGFNDTRMQHPVVSSIAATANYTVSPTTFVEATFGRSKNEQAGCSLGLGGPTFCQLALPVNEISNRNNAGLGSLPFLFPDATVIDPNYYAFEALEMVQPAFWQGGRILKAPNFTWGNRIANAPPNVPFPGFLNINPTRDISISLTKVIGRHTLKSGFYNTHGFKAEQTNNNAFGTLTFSNDTSNPLDSSFGYANAALGVFSSYLQASKYVETASVYDNTDAYVQDNWKLTSNLTMDYGLRLVHQGAQYDELGQAANFLPENWTLAQAPLLYVAGCANGISPCSGTNRQAVNPVTGEYLGPNSTLAIGALVPNSGNATNGLVVAGGDIPRATYKWPAIALGPRFGMAYDPTGAQRLVVRGGMGLFYDRPSTTTLSELVTNPPLSSTVTARYGQLQSLGTGGLTTQGAPAIRGLTFNSKLPSSTQWNGGVQMLLPWATAIDVEYVGQRAFNTVQSVNINAVDFGTAFLPQYQDPTLASSATPGATAMSTDLLRAMRGYGAVTESLDGGWRTFHSLQLSLNRRFRNGISFGLNDTIVLSDKQSTTQRLQHNADGSYSVRPDQAAADALLGTAVVNRQLLKGNFIWDLPDLHGSSTSIKTIGLLLNDWQISGIWTGLTGTAYSLGYTYQSGGSNVNLTGSPDYAGRVRLVGDPGSGCSSDPYRQFNAAAIQGPLVGSVGLESGASYLRGCFTSTLDLAIARNIRLGGGRAVQLRVDIFNAPNSATITGRNTTLSLTSPNDPVTPQNLPYDGAGNIIASRSQPRNAGFGVANAYQPARSIQGQIRFSF